MSFNKAKILRFNEEMSCAPPPGKYDPKFDSKIKGAIIEKSQRFLETKVEPAPSVCSHDSESSCSQSNKPRFRTPQLPRKKIVSTPRSAVETGRAYQRTPRSEIKSKKNLEEAFKFASEKNLVEQIEELTRVHSSQLIEKDLELVALYKDNSELKSNFVKLENSREIDFNNFKHMYDKEINKMKVELEEAQSALDKETQKHEEVLQGLKNQVKFLEDNLKNSNSLNNELEFQMSEAQLSLIELKNKYGELEEELKVTKNSMEKIVSEKEVQIKAIKEKHVGDLNNLASLAELNIENMSKKMEDKIVLLRAELEKLRMDDQEDLFEKMESITSEVKEKVKLFDSRASEFFETVQNLADNFDQKSKDLIESLISCSKINCENLAEFVKTSEELEEQKAINLEQKIQIVDLEDKILLLEEEVRKLRKQGRKYEIVQGEATKTIQVLSTRLFESESEVENMNECKEELILRKNALEEKINALRIENQDLKEKINDLEVNLIKDVMEVERNLISKVETFKKSSCDETVKLQSELEQKQKYIEVLASEIETYKHKTRELNEHKLFYEEIGTKYKEEIESLSYKFKDIEMRYENNMSLQKNKYDKLSHEFGEFKRVSKDELDALNRDKTILENECQEKVFEVNSLKLERDQLNEKIQKVENDIAQMEETGFENEKHIEELAMQLEHYTECGIKTAAQINNLSKELEEKQNELIKIQEDSTEKDLKIETLSSELTESKSYVQTMTEHVVALMGELAEKGREIENLSHEIEMKNVTMIQVSEEYEKVKKMCEEETKKCEDLEKDLHETQNDNEKYVDELISEIVLEKERCAELTHTAEESSLNLKISQEKIQELTQEQQEILVQMETLKKQLEEKTQENESLFEDISRRSDSINSFKEQIKNLEEKLESRNESLENQLDSLKLNENALNDEIFRLNNEKNALEKKYKEKDSYIQELKHENSNLSLKINEVSAEKDDLVEMVKRQWEEMELLTNEISNQQEEIDELKQLKEDKFDEVRALHQAELQNQIFALQQSLEDTQKVVIQLKNKEEDLVFKLKSAEVDLTQAENDKEANEKTIIELNCQVTDLESKFMAMDKRKNEYKAYAVEMEQENQQMKHDIEKLLLEKEKLQDEKHEDSMSVTSLNARIADLECRNRDLENMIGPFRDQLMQFESERAALLSKSENTEKELKALALEHAKALGHQNHRQKIRHVVHLTETISDLKKEMDKLRAENTKLRSTIMEQQESTLKKAGITRVNKKEIKENKENPVEIKSPLPKHKMERQASPADPLKQRNIT